MSCKVVEIIFQTFRRPRQPCIRRNAKYSHRQITQCAALKLTLGSQLSLRLVARNDRLRKGVSSSVAYARKTLHVGYAPYTGSLLNRPTHKRI